MMQLQLGIGEVITVLTAMVGMAWALLKLTLTQFEKRLDTRFLTINSRLAALDGVLLDVKKLELEQIRRDGQYAMLFVTKDEMLRQQDKSDKAIERVFDLLTAMNDKLDGKVDRDDCERRMLRKAER